MKPFDLEAAKAGAPLVTRSGESVRFVAHVPDARQDMRVIAINSDLIIFTKHENGCYWFNQEHFSDLFMAPVKRTVYVNFYKNNTATYYATEKAAEDAASNDAIAVAVPVEIEE